MRTYHLRALAAGALLVGAGCLPLTIENAGRGGHHGFVSSAHAQPLRKLIARLRGQTLPSGITKAEGRTEATEIDVASKYPGQLAEISVDEGSKVALGQVIARVSSPEFEAQLRAAQTDLQSAKEGLASAQAEIASREAALTFAKSDFERGQELMKSGFITKQAFEERQRNYEAADAAVKNMTARRDEAQKSIKIAEAKVQQVQSMIDELTLVSPRNGKVEYKLKRVGENVAADEPIVTVSDLTDIYMIVFLHAADAGRVVMGDEARVILDAVPDYVIPAQVSYVASESQFTPKTVETKDERAKLMFRVNLRINPEDLKRYYGRVESGLRGAGFVLTSRDAKWPAELNVKLPPAPAVQEPAPTPPPVAQESAPTPAPTPAPAVAAQGTAAAASPSTAPAPAPVTPSAPAAETQASTSASPAASPSAPVVAETAASEPTKQEPAASPTPESRASNPAPVVKEPTRTPVPAPVAEASASSVEEEPNEIAPASLAQLTGAWAQSAADCDTLFQRRGKALAYRQPVDKFAQAAIIESQRIRLPSATCRLERGSVVNGALKVSGECQDTISYTSRTVYLKLRSGNQLAYSPTGDIALETTLTKCQF